MHLPGSYPHSVRGGHFTSCFDPPPIYCISQPPAFISWGVHIVKKTPCFCPSYFCATSPQTPTYRPQIFRVSQPPARIPRQVATFLALSEPPGPFHDFSMQPSDSLRRKTAFSEPLVPSHDFSMQTPGSFLDQVVRPGPPLPPA